MLNFGSFPGLDVNLALNGQTRIRRQVPSSLLAISNSVFVHTANLKVEAIFTFT